MKGITRKEHCPTDLERICYGDDGEITEYDYLGSGDACEVKSDVDYEACEVNSEVDYEACEENSEVDYDVSDSAREFIREVMSLDRRHLFDIIALANRAARELHDAGIA